MEKLRIVLAEDHGVVRDGLKMLINAQEDLEVAGEAGDGRTALELICRMRPDIAIVDISMPIMNGLELVAELYRTDCDAKVLALTANEDRGYLQRLLKLGATGYLLKRSAAEELIKAIRTIATGGRYIDPSVIDELVTDLAAPRPLSTDATASSLSSREEEVLRLIAQGFANKEIAAKLDISLKTVETYKSRSMLKLGLRGRADIVRYAITQEWLRDNV